MAMTLVIGGNGMVGSRLVKMISERGNLVCSTSRDRGSKDIFFDLLNGDFSELLSCCPSVVFICAAKTNVRDCENFPNEAYLVNVTRTLELVTELVRSGAFVVWLSSSMVFDGMLAGRAEDAEYSPSSIYGQLKVDVELAILGNPSLCSRVAIVRLSKVVSPSCGIAAEFLRKLRLGENVEAFSDLYLSPVSDAYVCRALLVIAQSRMAGIFHLSGVAELTYVQFAHLLAGRAGLDRGYVVPTQSSGKLNNTVVYRPRYPALRMIRTSDLLGLRPEPIESTLDELFMLIR